MGTEGPVFTDGSPLHHAGLLPLGITGCMLICGEECACLCSPLLSSQSPLGRPGDNDEAETMASLMEEGALQLAVVKRLLVCELRTWMPQLAPSLMDLQLEPESQGAGCMSCS